jgi:hypothetical protein
VPVGPNRSVSYPVERSILWVNRLASDQTSTPNAPPTATTPLVVGCLISCILHDILSSTPLRGVTKRGLGGHGGKPRVVCARVLRRSLVCTPLFAPCSGGPPSTRCGAAETTLTQQFVHMIVGCLISCTTLPPPFKHAFAGSCKEGPASARRRGASHAWCVQRFCDSGVYVIMPIAPCGGGPSTPPRSTQYSVSNSSTSTLHTLPRACVFCTTRTTPLDPWTSSTPHQTPLNNLLIDTQTRFKRIPLDNTLVSTE